MSQAKFYLVSKATYDKIGTYMDDHMHELGNPPVIHKITAWLKNAPHYDINPVTDRTANAIMWQGNLIIEDSK